MTPSPAGPSPAFSPVRAWGSVLLLMLVGMINVMDRLLPGILAEPIKHDLSLSDTAIGLINGFGFLVVYALLGVPIARVTDRGLYGLVISSCLGLWSAMTLLGAAAQSAWQLALTRMGVALGEAGGGPATHAFIARNFPPNGRGAPLAVFTLSVPFASLLALLAGGLLGEALGWRATFVVMGVIGLVLSPLVLLLLGPRQGRASSGTPPLSLKPALLLFRKRSFVLTLLGSACIGVGGYSLATFSPAFLMRVHGMSLGEVGIKYGLAVGVAGAVGVLIAGVTGDRLSSRDPRWILWVMVLIIAALLPLSYAAFIVPNPSLALFCLTFANVIAIAYLAPIVAAIQRLAPVELRATASAFLAMFTALAGGAGPLITGMVSDALQAEFGPKALGYAMLVVPIAQTLAGLLYFAATFTFRRDIEVEAH